MRLQIHNLKNLASLLLAPTLFLSAAEMRAEEFDVWSSLEDTEFNRQPGVTLKVAEASRGVKAAAPKTNPVTVVRTKGQDTLKEHLELETAFSLPQETPANSNMKKRSTFKIFLNKGGAKFEPAMLVLSGPDSSANVEFVFDSELSTISSEPMALFVRDEATITWNPKEKTINANQEGQTELYFVWEGKMSIVPVRVDQDLKQTGFSIPETLVSLDNLLDQSLVPAHAAYREKTSPKRGPSVEESRKEAEVTLSDEAREAAKFYFEEKSPALKQVTLQIIDERSMPEAGLIYPVANAVVRIAGTDFVGESDPAGLVSLQDVPAGSRLLASVYDSGNRIYPTIAELNIAENAGDVLRVKVLHKANHDIYSRANQVVQRGELASVCGRLHSEDSQGQLAGLKVTLNLDADGPFYFNEFGPDPYGNATDSFGRFCFFNIRPGLAQVSVFDDNALVASLAVPVFGGRHLEEDFDITPKASFQTKLAIMAPALDQLYQEPALADRFYSAASAELLMIGDEGPLPQVEWGLLGSEERVSTYNDRFYILSQSAEFEPTLYTSDAFKDNVVTPLIPRGFVQDLYSELYAQSDMPSIAYDSSLGALLITYGLQAGDRYDDINIRVLDGYGREVKTGWYYGESSANTVKAVYFNMHPGVYAVLVETKSGHWVAASTVAVDYWTVSYSLLGSELRSTH